jgi:glycolate oxidase
MADATCLRLLVQSSRQWSRLPEGAGMLLVEFDGADADSVDADLDAAVALMERFAVAQVRRSHTDDEFAELWKVRKQVPWALMRQSPHQTLEDVTVPVSAAWPLIEATREITRRRGVEIANFGHLGDGNIHCTPLKPESLSVEEWHAELEELLPELYRRTAELGGTISGEHGIGHKRRRFMPVVFGEAELDAFRAVKRALDPFGIMNPGKVV